MKIKIHWMIEFKLFQLSVAEFTAIQMMIMVQSGVP